jgi:hypothetical protein
MLSDYEENYKVSIHFSRFSQDEKSSGILRRVHSYNFTNVSEVINAYIIIIRAMRCPDDGSSKHA